jgi:Ca-activated chloride channel family protein
VIILITDGDNNAGQISPHEAAGMAKALGIRVFPILVGKGGLVPYPVGVDFFGETVWERREFPVNPALLRQIAETTGGAYSNATDRETLEHGLQTVFEVGGGSRTRERFPELLLPAFWLAAAGTALRLWRFRSFP